MNRQSPRWFYRAWSGLLLGLMTLFVGYAIGYSLDKAFGTHWMYLVGLLLGIAGGFIQLIRQLLRDTKNDRT